MTAQHTAAPRLRRGDAAPDGEALGGAGPSPRAVRLSTLWSEGPALLVFLRHFG